MQVTVFVTGISLFCLQVILSSGRSPSSKGHKGNSVDQIIKIKEGEKTYYLNCSIQAKENNDSIVWRKNGQLLPTGALSSTGYYPLYCVSSKDEGNYTCHYTSIFTKVLAFKRIIVKIVAAAKDKYPCGKPKQGAKLVQEGGICDIKTTADYQCCKSDISLPQFAEFDISKPSNECSLYRLPDQKPWKIDVSWKNPAKNTSIWGWIIILYDIKLDPGSQRCVQINSRDKLLKWTFHSLPFGAGYTITLQSLPSNAGKNESIVQKTIEIPTRKDMCKQIGRKCKSEVCWPVENVAVKNEKTKAPVVSWRPSKYYRTPRIYQVSYWSDNCDKGQELVENGTMVILKKLNLRDCTNFSVQVRPIFGIREYGVYSKIVSFIYQPPGPQSNGKIIIPCSIAGASIVVLVIVVLIKCRNNPPPEPKPDDGSEGKIESEKATEVFIVHDRHCKLCDNVTHSLAHVLSQTGCINSVVDICCTNEITKSGIIWYEEKLQSCDKILIICTKECKKILRENEDNNQKNYASNVYKLIINAMLGRIITVNSISIVPVFFDYSSSEDIPLLLSQFPHYSLPSELEKLCLSLYPKEKLNEFDLNYASEKRKLATSKFLNEVECVRRNHYGNKKESLVAYFGKSTLKSSNYQLLKLE